MECRSLVLDYSEGNNVGNTDLERKDDVAVGICWNVLYAPDGEFLPILYCAVFRAWLTFFRRAVLGKLNKHTISILDGRPDDI